MSPRELLQILPPRHNLRCQNSRHTQPIMGHFKGLFAQLHLAAWLQIRAYWAERWTVSELTSPSRMPFMDKPIHCKKTGMHQRVQRKTHKHRPNKVKPLDKRMQSEKQTRSCSVDHQRYFKLQEERLSGQISTGFQLDSFQSSPLLYRDRSTSSQFGVRRSFSEGNVFWSLNVYSALLSTRYLGHSP